MKIYLYQGELINDLMDEEEDITQPDVENTIIDSIMEMCQHNV